MTRDIIKKDVSINWDKAKNFIPRNNEMIYYEDLNMFKVGDGKTRLNELNFTIKTFNGEMR